MKTRTYSRKKVVYQRRPGRIHKTLPDQSLSLKDIMERFTRGQSIDGVVKRDAIYSDQEEFDLEKIARSDFAEKADLAEELRENREQAQRDIQADAEKREREANEAKAKAGMPPEALPKA